MIVSVAPHPGPSQSPRHAYAPTPPSDSAYLPTPPTDPSYPITPPSPTEPSSSNGSRNAPSPPESARGTRSPPESARSNRSPPVSARSEASQTSTMYRTVAVLEKPPEFAPLSDPFEDAPAALLAELTGGVDKEVEGEERDRVTDIRQKSAKGPAPGQYEKCRICLGGWEEPLIQPCECTGTMNFVHKDCLIHWLNTSFKGRCEVCFYQFKIQREKTKLKNWKPPPMTSTQKAKYSIIFSLHVLALVFFIWSDYTLIGQCARADKDSTSYWIKLAIIVVATIAFLCFVIHQSRVYVRLYERVSVFNMRITNVFGKEENVSRFSKRDDLTMTSGMFDRTSGGSIGGFFDLQ